LGWARNTSSKKYLRQRRFSRVQICKASELLLQLVVGLGKLKVAGATGRALDSWSKLFAEQKRLAFGSQRLANNQPVVDTILGLVAALAVFAFVDLPAIGEMSPASGRFVALLTAFGLASAAVTNLAAVVGESLVAASAWQCFHRERSFGQGCLSRRGGWTGIGVRTAVGHVAGDRIDF
jgi:ABC-type bacteriocin/lantibiotic exporter with double-glycine peptidase domain